MPISPFHNARRGTFTGHMAALAIVLVLTMIFVACLSPLAFASTFTYVPLTLTDEQNVVIPIYMCVPEGDACPDLNFNFTLVAGTAIDGAEGYMSILAPSEKEMASVTSFDGEAVIFRGTYHSDTDPVHSVLVDTPLDFDTDGYSVYMSNLYINFKDTMFTHPGIYRYELTEQKPDNPSVNLDVRAETAQNAKRYIDVYIIDDGEGKLEYAGYTILENPASYAINATDASKSDYENGYKSTCYVNSMASFKLTLTKQISGNQASRDKYFKFNVTIHLPEEGTATATFPRDAFFPAKSPATIYPLDTIIAGNRNGVSVAELPTTNETYSVVWAANDDHDIVKTIYLRNGQTVTISGLPQGTTYTIEEDPEDYYSSMTLESDDYKNGTIPSATLGNDKISFVGAESVPGMAHNHAATFTNTKNGIVPTGIEISLIPGLLLSSIAFLCVVFCIKRKVNATD